MGRDFLGSRDFAPSITRTFGLTFCHACVRFLLAPQSSNSPTTLGCPNNLPHIWWFIMTDISSIKVPEISGSQSKHWQQHSSVQTLGDYTACLSRCLFAAGIPSTMVHCSDLCLFFQRLNPLGSSHLSWMCLLSFELGSI